jgi:hypothetical protein
MHIGGHTGPVIFQDEDVDGRSVNPGLEDLVVRDRGSGSG